MCYSNTSGSTANVVVGSDGSMLRSTSAKKYKTNIRDLSHNKDTLMKLKAVIYNSLCAKDDPNKDHLGIIADDAVFLYPELVTYNDKGDIEGFEYDHLTAVLLAAIQDQQLEIDTLKRQVKDLMEKLK